MGIPREQALLRADGEFGSLPCLNIAKSFGIPFLTRCLHRSILDIPIIREQMERALWVRVLDSGSGPHRYAADLGEIGLISKDLSSAETQIVRVVVSRCATNKKLRGRPPRRPGAPRFRVAPWPPPSAQRCAGSTLTFGNPRCARNPKKGRTFWLAGRNPARRGSFIPVCAASGSMGGLTHHAMLRLPGVGFAERLSGNSRSRSDNG